MEKKLMYTSMALVKNLDSISDELKFSEFKLNRIRQDDDDVLEEARNKLFPGTHANKDDWIYIRCYDDTITDWYSRIPNDIEQTLFLLRLFKVGDLVFLSPRITKLNGEVVNQLPYRVMSDISTFHDYELQTAECSQFDNFALEMLSQKNWEAAWFQTARRFFLYGGSKEFNPNLNLVDRIVDYMIVMESILVPESDFVGKRLRERAALLQKSPTMDNEERKNIINYFYNIRSKIVHGSDVSSFKNGILDGYIGFENIVRKVIIETLKVLPENELEREKFLKGLFDVSDQDRANKVYQDFCAIKDLNEKRRCFNLISNLLSKTENRKQKTGS
jgi:hypothetical protein